MLKLSRLKEITEEQPAGIFIVILLIALILIFRGLIKCLFLVFIRIPQNVFTPSNILSGGICDPNKIMQVKIGLWIIELTKPQSVVIFLLIISLIYFLWRRRKNY